MKAPILSIIIPVYNVEKYIEECFYSVYSDEIIKNIEIIIVDDGSTDNSPNICDKLAKHNNTYVYHKKNGGLASARNYGYTKARGKYIVFLDSDDKVETQSLPRIIKYIDKNEKDLFFLNIKKVYPNGKTVDLGERIDRNKIFNVKKDKCIRYLSRRPKYPASANSKIYRKKFLDNHSIAFPNDNRVSEDMGFAFKCILLANSYDKIELPYYYYRQNRKGSITNTISSKSFIGLSSFIEESIEEYTKNGKPLNKNVKNMFNYLAYEYEILLFQYSILPHTEKEKAYAFLRKYKYVMKWSKTGRNIVIGILVSLLGIKTTSYILRSAKRGTEWISSHL